MGANFCVEVDHDTWRFSFNHVSAHPKEFTERQRDDLPLVAQELWFWLDQILNDPSTELAFRELAGEASLQRIKWERGEVFLKVNDKTSSPERKESDQKAAAAFYAGMANYLAAGDRFISLDARLAYLFCAWQAYNLVKALCRKEENWTPEYKQLLAGSYTRLKVLLVDSRFAMPARYLARLLELQNPNDPLLRQRMRRSLILGYQADIQTNDPGKLGGKEINPENSIPAPGLSSETGNFTKDACLHPFFANKENKEGQRAVRSLVTRQLLPRYDFDASLQIAHWLKHPNSPELGRFYKFKILAGSLLAVLLVVLLGTLISAKWGATPVIALLEFIVLGMAAGVFLVRSFDQGILIHLALPRLLGGVAAGYLLLITQNDSIDLAGAFTWIRQPSPNLSWLGHLWQTGAPLVCLLWTGVIAISAVYLNNEIFPWTLERRETFWRTLFTILFAVFASGFVGLLATALTTAAYGYLSLDGLNPIWGLILGPFGWVDVKQWWIFTPIALIVGMISQFILEDRTLPESVWAPEQD